MDPQAKAETKYKVQSIMGIISDKVDVATAKIRNDEGAEFDVAVIKGTLNVDVVPKEKHVRTLKIACSGSAPRPQVDYIIHALVKRLEENKTSWLVTLKCLIVFHRLMREVDSTFQEEMLRFSERTGIRRIMRLETFADHTTKETWDLSAWIRVYSVYLDERLEVFRAMKFDPEQDAGKETADSKLKECPKPELLEKLPMVQKLLGRMLQCVPQGTAQHNDIVIQAASMVLREVRAVYKVNSEGIINLCDKFFEMERSDAIRGLELYKENVALNEKLNTFIASINNIHTMKGQVQFPTLQALPPDFQQSMEDYVKEAPRQLDANAMQTSGSMRKPGAPPSTTTASAIVRQGGTTSAAIAGGPTGGTPASLKVTGPQSGSAPPPAKNVAEEVDLLGGDLNEVSLGPSASQQQAGAPAPQQPQQQQPWGSPTGAPPPPGPQSPGQQQPMWGQQQPGGPWGAAPGPQPTNGYPGAPPAPGGFAPFPGQAPMPQPGAPGMHPGGFPHAQSMPATQGGFNPFGAPPMGPPAMQSGPPMYGTPAPHMQQPGPYGAPPPHMQQPPYGAPMQQHPNPFGGAPQGGPPPGYGGYPGAPGAPPQVAANPFGAPGGNAYGGGAPQGVTAWGAQTGPRGGQPKDPLSDLSFDLLGGNPAAQPPPPKLRDLKGQAGMGQPAMM